MLATDEASDGAEPWWRRFRPKVEWRALVTKQRAPWLVAGLIAGFIALTWVLFALDSWAHSGEVLRGVRVGDFSAAGRSEGELGSVLDKLEKDYATTKVSVRVEAEKSSDDGVADDVDSPDSFTIDAGEIGLRIDRVVTAKAAMNVGRDGTPVARWWGWLSSIARGRQAGLGLDVDRQAVTRVAAERGQKGDKPASEATIAIDRNGKFAGVEGKAGRGIDADRLARDLLEAANRGTPIKVAARYGEVQPRFTEDDADRLAARAEQLVKDPLPMVAEGVEGSLSSGTLRTLLSAVPGPTALELDVDERKAADAAAKALSKAGTPAKEPTFGLDANGGVTITPGGPGRACCTADAGNVIAAAVFQRPAGPVTLQLEEKQPKYTFEEAQGWGVKEKVTEYTTKHPCCAPRVTNIHRIADLVRGQVIPPGKSLSINDVVGERTAEKGFVKDKVIEDGKFAEDIGGGVSQFATTLFNASWYAGMEFGEYQSHSLYISRYPYGREATLGFPHPDLVVKNPSPYGVMIWPTYTNTSVTVALFSTKWVSKVDQLGQDEVANGSCTRIITKRQRTFVDGRVVNDSTVAQYRANEGQNCADEQPPDETSTTSSTAPPRGPTTTTRSQSTTTSKKPSASTSSSPPSPG